MGVAAAERMPVGGSDIRLGRRRGVDDWKGGVR